MQLRIIGSKEEIENYICLMQDIGDWNIGGMEFKIVKSSRYLSNNDGTFRKYINLKPCRCFEESEY